MDKTKALSAALSQIERQFGKGSVMKLGKNDPVHGCRDDFVRLAPGWISRSGVGGLPKGRVVEIYGPESLRQDHAGAAYGGRGPEEGRHLRLHRRRNTRSIRSMPASSASMSMNF